MGIQCETIKKNKNINPRIGITQARHAGSKSAIGDVVVFLDSHCETNRDWLRPLLQHIKDNRKVVLTPIIDLLQQDTFEYQAGNIMDFEVIFNLGGFSDFYM